MKLLLGSTALGMTRGPSVYVSVPAAAQQLQYACDQDGDGLIDASEARLCTDRAFEELAAGEAVHTEEQLGAIGQGQQGMMFSEVDENDDGESAARSG